jgi:hypothetical protein
MRLKKMNGEFTFGPKGLLKWSSQDGLISFCELDFWVLKFQLGGVNRPNGLNGLLSKSVSTGSTPCLDFEKSLR